MYKYGKAVPELSAQQVLDCNFLNEGCNGGWPELIGFFYESGHLVDEDCAPYYAKSGSGSATCAAHKDCVARAKVKRTYKVGKGWGRVTEKQIMKELLMNGALSVEYQSNQNLILYGAGIATENSVN